MEPKFQSSFIPKGPITATASSISMGQREKGKGLFYSLSLVIFGISIVLAMGVFGYKYYLKYSIKQMGNDLENARATLQPELIDELTRLDNRLVSAKELIAKHQILLPLFEFLEVSTAKAVRFNDFTYLMTDGGLELTMKGEARGYTALAFQADVFNKSQYFKGSIFSDLNLNDKGDVNFTLRTMVDPALVSYKKAVELIGTPPVASANFVATSTSATTTPATATSTSN